MKTYSLTIRRLDEQLLGTVVSILADYGDISVTPDEPTNGESHPQPPKHVRGQRKIGYKVQFRDDSMFAVGAKIKFRPDSAYERIVNAAIELDGGKGKAFNRKAVLAKADLEHHGFNGNTGRAAISKLVGLKALRVVLEKK